MSKLEILRGVPASGKSTHAIKRVVDGWTRINRDDIRYAMYGSYWGTNVNEDAVTDVENTMLDSALAAGENVVLDATNLRNSSLKTKLSFANLHRADVVFVDFPISYGEAVLRDQKRERQVGDKVIKNFFTKYKIDLHTGLLATPPLVLPTFDSVVSDVSMGYKPTAYIIDTDGTVANHEGVRGIYDHSRYHLDTPHRHVVEVVKALQATDHRILGLSGRDAQYRKVTLQWWNDQGLIPDGFFMRPDGDKRMDAIVKYELFKQFIEPSYNVLGAFDDRPQVIRMWKSIGVPVFDVGLGKEF